MATTPNELARDRIVALSRNPTDLVSFWRQVTEVLRRSIPHYLTPCWYTLDPASLLITSHYQDGLPEFPSEWLANEYYTDDVNKIVDIVRSETGISTLHEATRGDPSGSIRWHATRRMGGDQELLLRLRTRSGEVWAPSVSTGSRAPRSSIRRTRRFSSRSPRTWPKVLAEPCWWAKRVNRSRRMPRAC